MKHEKLQLVCEEIVDDVDGVLGCALVDLVTGLPLAMDVRPGSLLSDTAMELMAAAGVSYFWDSLRLGEEIPDDEAVRDGDRLQEIQTTTEDTYHYMALVPGEEQELLILITDRKRTNLGLGWIAMRQALRLVEHADGRGVAESSDPQAPDRSAQLATSQRLPPPNPESRHSGVRGRRTIWGQR